MRPVPEQLNKPLSVAAGRRAQGARPDPSLSSLCFDFAGVPVGFAVDDPGLRSWLRRRFERFESPDPPRWQVLVEVSEPGASFTRTPVDVQANERGFRIVGRTFSAEADLGERQARVRGPRAGYPVATLVRHLLPLVHDDALVVHAAMLADDGRGFLCSGPSGSGKSTLARLLPGLAFCDELAMVRRVGGGFAIQSLPFWEARPGRAALAGVLLLGHGQDHRRRPLGAGRAVQALAQHVLWPVTSGAAVERCFHLLGCLVELTPVWELDFVPRPDVWRVIASAPEPGATDEP
jgi:hypothetical protein